MDTRWKYQKSEEEEEKEKEEKQKKKRKLPKPTNYKRHRQEIFFVRWSKYSPRRLFSGLRLSSVLTDFWFDIRSNIYRYACYLVFKLQL